jgi:hypothetical protein
MIIQLVRNKLSHVFYSDGSVVAPSGPVWPSLRGINVVTRLPLADHPIYRVISPPTHVSKEMPPSVRVEITDKSLLTIRRAK